MFVDGGFYHSDIHLKFMVIRIFTWFANSCRASDWDSRCLPRPLGSRENQFAPFRDWGERIDFQYFILLLGMHADTHLKF